MISFSPSEEQQMIVNMVKQFATDEIRKAVTILPFLCVTNHMNEHRGASLISTGFRQHRFWSRWHNKGYLLLQHSVTTADAERLPGNVAGRIRRQEYYGVCRVLRSA